jgi:hypothetical protein
LLGTIEDSQERCYPGAHSAVQISLAALDVVMKVITEKLNIRDGGVHLVGMLKVAGKEHWEGLEDTNDTRKESTNRTSHIQHRH